MDISAPTFFGIRHGLETLGQLIAFDDDNECLRVIITLVQFKLHVKFTPLLSIP